MLGALVVRCLWLVWEVLAGLSGVLCCDAKTLLTMKADSQRPEIGPTGHKGREMGTFPLTVFCIPKQIHSERSMSRLSQKVSLLLTQLNQGWRQSHGHLMN